MIHPQDLGRELRVARRDGRGRRQRRRQGREEGREGGREDRREEERGVREKREKRREKKREKKREEKRENIDLVDVDESEDKRQRDENAVSRKVSATAASAFNIIKFQINETFALKMMIMTFMQ